MERCSQRCAPRPGPVRLSTTSSASRPAARCARSHGRLAHRRLVERGAPGGVEEEYVVTAEPRRRKRAAGDVGRGLAGHDRRRLSTSACLARIASCSMAAGRRVSSKATSTFWRSVLASRKAGACRSSWSCRGPAGRPSGSRSAGSRRAPQRLRLLARPASRSGRRRRSLDHLVGRPDRADHRLPGRHDLGLARAMKSRTTGSATSASSAAPRAPRAAPHRRPSLKGRLG